MKNNFLPQFNYDPALLAQAAGGLLSAGIGFIQRGQANKWLKNNQQPIEALPSEIKRNQELSEIRANTGLPSQQYNNAMRNIQRQQLMSLRAAGQMGGGKALSILGGINEQGNNAVGDLDARDAQMRLDNEGRLIGVNNNVANWKSQLFDRNVRQKWQRQWEQMMGQLGSGNQNIVGGIDGLASAGIGLIGSGKTGGASDGSADGSGYTGVSTDWLLKNRPMSYKR